MAVVIVPKGTTDLTAYGADTDTLQFLEGNQTVSAGLNKSGLTEGFAAIHVAETFTGVIGGAGGALLADVDSGAGKFTYHAGGGACYYRPNGDDNLCDELEIISAGTFNLISGGTVTECSIGRGNLVCSGDVIVTNHRQTAGNSMFRYHATAITSLWVGGGMVTTERSATTAEISQAQVIFKREDSSATVGAATTLNLNGPCYVKWCLGNITTVNLKHPDAIIDFSEAPNALTVTNLIGFGKAIARSRRSSKFATVTITNTTTYNGSSDYWSSFGSGFGGGGFGTS
jgi:hypothetical protein